MNNMKAVRSFEARRLMTLALLNEIRIELEKEVPVDEIHYGHVGSMEKVHFDLTQMRAFIN